MNNTINEIENTKNTPNTDDVENVKSELTDKEKERIAAAKIQSHEKAKKMMIKRNTKMTAIILVIVLVAAILVSMLLISCMNDMLAVNVPRDDPKLTVVIEKNMDTKDVLHVLKDAGAIHNITFCRVMAKLLDYTNDGYVPGTYEIKRSMGLEKMLNKVKLLDVDQTQTVRITFPEGMSADEIIEKLEAEGVCSADKLRSTISNSDFNEDYEFLKSRTLIQNRYNQLDGYLYPDTYDFYIGESPESVIDKFLTNFEKRWTDEYADTIEEKGLTMDQVVILASIVEKEARNAEMGTVASILFNRIDANMRFDCDSTKLYVENASKVNPSLAAQYNSSYNTYECSSYPVGAICNPGDAAIQAVINAPDTNYYYFIHDANNEFRTAESLEEQEWNINNYGVANVDS